MVFERSQQPFIEKLGIKIDEEIDSSDKFNEESYYKRLDGMAEFILETKRKLEAKDFNLLNDMDELLERMRIFSSKSKLELKDKNALLNGLASQFKTLIYLNGIKEKIGENPKQMFRHVFGFEAEKDVEVEYRFGYVIFILDHIDKDKLERIDEGSSDNLKPEMGYGIGTYPGSCGKAVTDKKLSGKVMWISRNPKADLSRGRKKSLFLSASDLDGYIKHELTHALANDLFAPILGYRVNMEREGKQDEYYKTFVYQYLNDAKTSYFAGDLHKEKFISEFGPERLKMLTKEKYYSDDKSEKFPTLLQPLIDRYRKDFFIMDDVFHLVEGKIDSEKLNVLCFILPPDRLERLLHFVGKNPVKWKKEWLIMHNNEDLIKREEDQILKFNR